MAQDDWLPDEGTPLDEVRAALPAGAESVVQRPRLHYMESYRFLFTSKHWGMNLLAGVVCQLVPVVGPITFLGYCYEIVEGLHLWGGRRYPDFDTNRLFPYLKRGLWPFLVALVLTLPLVLLIAVGVAAVGLAASTRDEVLLVTVAVAAGLTVLALSVLIQFVALPLLLRAGLSQEFQLAGAWPFARGFLARTWKEMLLAWLFLMASGVCVSFVGLLLCYIGIYPAVVLMTLAQQHLLYQIYQIYLARGGAPIPLHRDEEDRPYRRSFEPDLSDPDA